MLTFGFNVLGFSWITYPAATELEMIVLNWFAQMLKLPDAFLSTGGGIIQNTSCESVFLAIVATRDATLRKVGKILLESLWLMHLIKHILLSKKLVWLLEFIRRTVKLRKQTFQLITVSHQTLPMV